MPHFPAIDEQLAQIRRGVEQVLPDDALAEKLKRAEKTGTPLVVKLGCDPSRPDLHLGHAVVLRKLRQFQDLGHQAVLIVGDFTGMIGDPTGKSKTRPSLSLDETRANGASYFEQASAILDPEKTRIVYNSEWLGAMNFADVIGLAGTHTVAQMMEREDFANRYAEGKPISLHEFLYPLAQAQDSVAIESDIELGGTDQTFNLLVGRAVQQANGMEPQVCITLPLLEGTDGVEKMSKSLDNYIGITEPPSEMYGKTLSIPDDLIYRWAVLATDIPTDDLPRWKKYAEDDPRNAKHDLAWHIVQLYHGEAAAKEARGHFERTVINRDVTQDVEEFRPKPTMGATRIGLLDLMRQLGFAESNGEAKRLIKQNAVSIDGEKVKDFRLDIDVADRAPFVLKAGKLKYKRIVW